MTDTLEGEKKDTEATLDFSSLILGFSSAALYHIGYKTVRGESSSEKNFSLAKQNIDIIQMLAEKTKGNLNKDEESLVFEVLVDLNKKFNQAKEKKDSAG